MNRKISKVLCLLAVICLTMSIWSLGGCKTDNLTLSVNIADAGTVTGNGYYETDEDVSIVATTNQGYYFLGWYYEEELLATSNQYNFKMWDKAVNIEAKFTALPDDYEGSEGATGKKYSLTVSSSSKKLGKVNLDDNGNVERYNVTKNAGDPIKLTSLTISSKQFLGWFDNAGNLITTNGSFEFAMPIFNYEIIARWNCGCTEYYAYSSDYHCKECDATPVKKDGFTIINVNNEKILYSYKGNSTSLVIPSEADKIAPNAFKGSNNITDITCDAKFIADIPKANLTSIKITSGAVPNNAFHDCANLTTVSLESNVRNIGKGAFATCTSLTKVNFNGTIDDWAKIRFGNAYANPLVYAKKLYINDKLITEAVLNTATEISDFAFCNCSSLTSVVIGDSVESIGSSAFYGCSGLTSIVIPDSVTSIGGWAFQNCSSLTSVVIPDSVTSIGDWAFSSCSSLTSIKYRGTLSQWAAISKGYAWNDNTGKYTITYNYTGE